VLEAIRSALEAENIGYTQPDAMTSAGRVGDVIREIERSLFVIADVSAGNPNVLYELGYANALRKPTILIRSRQDASEFPSDLRGNFYLPYDPGEPEQLSRDLRRLVREHMAAAQEVA
jgi:nucleoside 2-deoxyribosyltransferase